MPTKIEWADEVWNPVTGCTKVSKGCRNCYAESMANRFWGERKFTDVQCHPERLEIPLLWKKPKRIFVNSMSDLFHDDVPNDFLVDVFNTMIAANHHTYMILTKRPERMCYFLNGFSGYHAMREMANDHQKEHIWLGVSVENQATADERIPRLLQTPAAVRFVSVEPCLGAVDLEKYLVEDFDGSLARECEWEPPDRDDWRFHSLSWCIAGGETGPHARPMHPDWARSLRDQCQAAGVPYFFKSWGEWAHRSQGFHAVSNLKWGTLDADGNYFDVTTPWNGNDDNGRGEAVMVRVGKKRAGRLLDGKVWNEFP